MLLLRRVIWLFHVVKESPVPSYHFIDAVGKEKSTVFGTDPDLVFREKVTVDIGLFP